MRKFVWLLAAITSLLIGMVACGDNSDDAAASGRVMCETWSAQLHEDTELTAYAAGLERDAPETVADDAAAIADLARTVAAAGGAAIDVATDSTMLEHAEVINDYCADQGRLTSAPVMRGRPGCASVATECAVSPTPAACKVTSKLMYGC